MISRREAGRQSLTLAGAGFTLLEMLIVIAILGFALVLVTGFRSPWSKGLDVEAAASGLASQLRLGRSAAIADNRPVEFTLDLAAHRYRVGAGVEQALSPSLSLQLLAVAGERRAAGIGGILFNPDGSSTGGRIVLGNGARRVAVGVDWLTGRVSVADVR